jgi:hypothetical protein
VVANAATSLAMVSNRHSEPTGSHAQIPCMAENVARNSRLRRLSCIVRFHVRVMVPDSIYGRESIWLVCTGHQIVRHVDAADRLSVDCKTKYATNLVRQPSLHTQGTRRRNLARRALLQHDGRETGPETRNVKVR